MTDACRFVGRQECQDWLRPADTKSSGRFSTSNTQQQTVLGYYRSFVSLGEHLKKNYFVQLVRHYALIIMITPTNYYYTT